jgi:hypothetical protein
VKHKDDIGPRPQGTMSIFQSIRERRLPAARIRRTPSPLLRIAPPLADQQNRSSHDFTSVQFLQCVNAARDLLVRAERIGSQVFEF